MKKLYPVLIFSSLVFIILWQLFFTKTSYWIICVSLLIISMLPFFVSFERTEHTSREITLIASFIALAVVSRAVFYLVPQVKPIAAVVGIGGACLGAKRGYLIGAFSMFVSNFIFGQGAWTPFQMVAMGLVGFAFGFIFKLLKKNKFTLAAVGFFSVLILYGLVVDLSSVLYFNADLTVAGVLSVYAAGVPFNLVFAATTALFLFLFGESFVRKIDRINTKYGIFKAED